nr:hypothetical protein [Methanobacterium formicicum]
MFCRRIGEEPRKELEELGIEVVESKKRNHTRCHYPVFDPNDQWNKVRGKNRTLVQLPRLIMLPLTIFK